MQNKRTTEQIAALEEWSNKARQGQPIGLKQAIAVADYQMEQGGLRKAKQKRKQNSWRILYASLLSAGLLGWLIYGNFIWESSTR